MSVSSQRTCARAGLERVTLRRKSATAFTNIESVAPRMRRRRKNHESQEMKRQKRYSSRVPALVEQLSAAIATREDVVAAWLFGSRARGTERPNSDIDVAVLLRSDPAQTLEKYGFEVANDLASRVAARVDLVVINDASADLVHRVLRDGILLVDRDRSRRLAFEVRKRAEYLDMEPIRRAYRRGRAST